MSSANGAGRSGAGRHVLSALVQNTPGVLAHVSGMFASRGFNIDSLAVGETEDPHLSRITVVVMGDDRHLEQVRKQMEKIVTVVKVSDISREDYVERDLMLIKVNAPAERRAELQGLVEIFRGRVVDVSQHEMMIEISGQEKRSRRSSTRCGRTAFWKSRAPGGSRWYAAVDPPRRTRRPRPWRTPRRPPRSSATRTCKPPQALPRRIPSPVDDPERLSMAGAFAVPSACFPSVCH